MRAGLQVSGGVGKSRSRHLRVASLVSFASSTRRVLSVRFSILIACFLCLDCFAQRQRDLRTPPLDPVQAQKEAEELVLRILSQKPDQSITNTGVLKISDPDRTERNIPVRIDTVSTPTNWFNVYVTRGAQNVRLTVTHAVGRPNEYLISDPADSLPRKLFGNEAMVPFAGSDFWLADLGLEFLSWPKQRLLKKEMRHSRFCQVLESANPRPVAGGYARVVSWIENEEPYGVVHADAYDSRDKRLKEFDPTKVEKVEGVYQLKTMQMRNLKSRSNTIIEFDLSTQ